MKHLNAPRMRGAFLHAGVWMLENPVAGPLLRQNLLRTIGIPLLREASIQEGPAITPPLPHFGKEPPLPPGGVFLSLFPACQGFVSPGSGGFSFISSQDLRQAFLKGYTTPLAVATRFIENSRQAAAAKTPMHIFIACNEADILAQAEKSTLRYREQASLGPLDGVPVAVKDELDLEGYPTTVGTSFLGDTPAREDAEAVARLRTAGAVLVGKTNMHEIGIGVTGCNHHHGPARNPYHTDRITGGSSSGSAAAVAAGLCPIAIGADGGGSVRIPAALCGVVGLKPTFGRVPEYGAAPLCWSVAHIGPLGATVKDVALSYLVMAGPDLKDPASLRQPPPFLSPVPGDLAGLRLGIFPAWFSDADAPVVTACTDMVKALRKAGAVVREITIPGLNLMRIAHLVTIVSEMATAHQQYYTHRRQDYGPDTRINLCLAHALKSTDYIKAQALRNQLCQVVYRLFDSVDMIITPTTACTARPIPPVPTSDLALTDAIMRFATLANLSGLPALSLPIGYDNDGLPIGMQFMGPAFSEDRLLSVAAVAESFTHRTKPPTCWSLL